MLKNLNILVLDHRNSCYNMFLNCQFICLGPETIGYKVIAYHQYCGSESDEHLGSPRDEDGVAKCAIACKNKGCKHFYIEYGTDRAGCFWAKTEIEDCDEWTDAPYNSYVINSEGK